MRRATRQCVDEAIRLATVSMAWRSAVTSVSTVFRAKGCNSRSTESGLSVLFRCIVTTLFWTLLERPRRGTLRDSGIAGSPRSTAGAAANPCDAAGAAVLSQSAAGPQHQQLFSHCLYHHGLVVAFPPSLAQGGDAGLVAACVECQLWLQVRAHEVQEVLCDCLGTVQSITTRPLGATSKKHSQRGRQPLKVIVHGKTEKKHCHKVTGEHKHMRMSFYCVVKCSSAFL
jgi:hypothetical protein